MLDREEYIEQAYFFRTLLERLDQRTATQDLLGSLRDEILATTKLPLAIDYLAGELRLTGAFASAMAKLPHYFTPFQTFLVSEAEDDHSRFDMRIALEILSCEATYRAAGASRAGVFLFDFESLCRNRMNYDRGLDAVAQDPMFDEDWRKWIYTVRRQIGLVDFADLLYVRSAFYVKQRARQGVNESEPERPTLFDEQEGKIALAHRRKDPLLLFAALHRQLGYPKPPRSRPIDETPMIVPQLARRVEKLETRLKLMEEEQKGGIDLSRFYVQSEGGLGGLDEPDA